ncbi:hypothetical protein BC833DRAFT_590568 [Globomyces pollinis-pini]|nr:hypothetical protein BC833DRAFT_590568 [Globomyces pollinis-pini]
MIHIIYINFILSLALTVISLTVDLIYYKTSLIFSHKGYLELIIRISIFPWSIASFYYFSQSNSFKTFVDQKIGLTIWLIIIQWSVAILVLSLFGLFLKYWITIQTLVPTTRFAEWLRARIERKPYAILQIVSCAFIVYLTICVTPIFFWRDQQLRYFYWRQFVQSILQLSLGLFLIPVFFHLVMGFTKYISDKNKTQVSKNWEIFDNVTFAITRIIIANICLMVYLLIVPTSNLFFDYDLILYKIPTDHYINTIPAPDLFTIANIFASFTGGGLSILFLAKYIKMN